MPVLQTDKNRTVCMIAIFLPATGARLNEALQAKWVEISRVNKIWQIPAANAKGKRHRSIVLNTSAFSVLDRLNTDENMSIYSSITRQVNLM